MFFSKPKLFTQFGEWTLVQTLDLIKVILVTSSKLKMFEGHLLDVLLRIFDMANTYGVRD